MKRTVISIFRVEPVTFSYVVKEAAKSGISRPTVARYLRQYAKSGIIVHDEQGYRLNPLVGKTGGLPFVVTATDRKGESPQLVFKFSEPTKKYPAADWWSSKQGVRMNIETPQELLEALQHVVDVSLKIYMLLLGDLVNLSELPLAREIASHASDQISSCLMMLARAIWEQKANVPLGSLIGKQLSYKIEPVLASIP